MKKKYIAELMLISAIGFTLFGCNLPENNPVEAEVAEDTISDSVIKEIAKRKEVELAEKKAEEAWQEAEAKNKEQEKKEQEKKAQEEKEKKEKEAQEKIKKEKEKEEKQKKEEQKKKEQEEKKKKEQEQTKTSSETSSEADYNTAPETGYVSEQPEDQSYGYNESYAANGTKVWWTAVNSEPQLILSSGGVNGKERPSSVAKRTGAKYVINGGEWWERSGIACGVTGIGDTIYQALNDGENGDTLILKQDGQLDSVYMTEAEYRQINPKWAVKGFVPIINGGARTSYTHARQPRTFIGQGWDGTYYIGVSGGRGINGSGLTYNELYDFAVGQMSSDLRFLYAMDGGGSSSFVCNGAVCNSPTDGSERAVANCIAFY